MPQVDSEAAAEVTRKTRSRPALVQSAWDALQEKPDGSDEIDTWMSLPSHPVDPSTVALHVDLGLERTKDACNVARVELAHQAADELENVLRTKGGLTGDKNPDVFVPLILHVRVSVCSFASSSGSSKVGVIWCLEDVETCERITKAKGERLRHDGTDDTRRCGKIVWMGRAIRTDKLLFGAIEKIAPGKGQDAVIRMSKNIARDILKKMKGKAIK